MPNREEIHHSAETQVAGLPAATTGTVTSTGVDTQGFDSCHFNINFGATAPAPTSITIEESDSFGSGYAAAPAASVIDDGSTHAVSTTRRIAYVGSKRYARCVVVLSASTIMSITCHRGYAANKPVQNPI